MRLRARTTLVVAAAVGLALLAYWGWPRLTYLELRRAAAEGDLDGVAQRIDPESVKSFTEGEVTTFDEFGETAAGLIGRFPDAAADIFVFSPASMSFRGPTTFEVRSTDGVLLEFRLRGGRWLLSSIRAHGDYDPVAFAARHRRSVTLMRLTNVGVAVSRFWLERGNYPAELEELAALGLVAREHLTDAWGFDLHYEVPGAEGAPYALYSLGADGAPGGSGENRDLPGGS